jgi:hypothetical protein
MNVTLHWPQVAILSFYALALLVAVREHGKPRKGINNAWVAGAVFLGFLAILYAGGFFG